MGHMSNLFIATVLSNGTSDECQWYCLCYLTDVTLGTFLNVSVLALVESFLVPDASSSIFKFGEYGDPPNLCVWLAQLLVWLAIIVTSKALIVLFLFLCADMLINGSSQVFAYLEAYPRIELVVVMVCIPFVFNILAFWVTDRLACTVPVYIHNYSYKMRRCSFLKKTDFESITQTDVREYQGCSSRTSIVCHHYGTHPSLCVTAGLGDLGGRSVESGSSKC